MLQRMLADALARVLIGAVGIGAATAVQAASSSNEPTSGESRTIVRQGSCVSFDPPGRAQSSPVAAFLEGVGSTAITLGIDFLFNAIKKAGEDKAITRLAHRPIDLGTALHADDGRCLQVFAGTFTPKAPGGMRPTGYATAKDIQNRLLHDAGIDGTLDYFWEGELELHEGTEAMHLVTRALLVNRFLDPKRSASKGADHILTLAFTDPGASTLTDTSIKSTGGAVAFDFGRIVLSKTTPSVLRRYPPDADELAPRSHWLAVPEKARKSGATLPRTVWAARTETTDGSAFFRVLSSLIEPNKDKLKTAATTALIPSAAAAAENQAEVAADKAVHDAISAEATALGKVRAYFDWWKAQQAAQAAPPDYKREEGLVLMAAAALAQGGANRAAKAAGRAEPFSGTGAGLEFGDMTLLVREPPTTFKPN